MTLTVRVQAPVGAPFTVAGFEPHIGKVFEATSGHGRILSVAIVDGGKAADVTIEVFEAVPPGDAQ